MVKAGVKVKAKAKVKTTVKAKENEELQDLRKKRAREREKRPADRMPPESQGTLMNASKDQPDLVARLIRHLDHIHKRK